MGVRTSVEAAGPFDITGFQGYTGQWGMGVSTTLHLGGGGILVPVQFEVKLGVDTHIGM